MTQVTISAEPEAASTPSETEGAVSDNTADAAEYEKRVRKEMDIQFTRVKDESRAIFGQVHGRPGVRSSQKWAEMLEKAGDEIGNGKFLVRQLGAERYLSPEMVAVLISLRQDLLANIKRPTAADIMRVDSAVIAYFNLLRVQGWIGNLSLVIERECFGQEPLVGDGLEEQLRRLAEVIMPLQDRAHRMMMRSLSAIG